MKISVMGLGYVGSVSAACLTRNGHTVIGVDTNQTKVDLINSGLTPIIEKDVGEIIRSSVNDGLLSATTKTTDAVRDTELSIICVGTPSMLNGNLDLSYVRRVCEEIGTALQDKKQYHTVVVRSTMLPGSMRDIVIPTLENASGKHAGKDFGICINPEFLREGTAIYDFYHPPKTVIGSSDKKTCQIVSSLYEGLEAPLIQTDLATAEMVKYTDNVWHALKIGFANEIGLISKAVGIDGHKVMDIFCSDRKLNLSSNYLKPGFAFGGSCLPKDVRALAYKSKNLDLTLPIINSILHDNERHIRRGVDMITSKGHRRVGILGISFKAGTDDLRESPVVEVIESLLGKGYDLKLYDYNVNLATISGANKDYILNKIPHISRLMVDSMDEVMEHAETVVIGNNAQEFCQVLGKTRPDQVVVDFVRISDTRSQEGKYDGICW
ncbi:nucleotide sugar dehydrogenase [Alkalimarinus coralli]|uniref:nucleotide sugar dehydrogenase n=1 Tax=Alkalimarinus coralli TaxID=2935863 RepID=UPI00202AE1DD|nr:nucleotide sugar dehydrogenase [Alkalimarinus coralli]